MWPVENYSEDKKNIRYDKNEWNTLKTYLKFVSEYRNLTIWISRPNTYYIF